MKKFVFTNQKYYDIKNNEDQGLKRELKNVDKDIEAVLAAIALLVKRFETQRESYNKACKEGVKAEVLRTYQWFFPYIQEEQEKCQRELALLEEERRKLREKLIKLHNELKVLEEMRAEQHQAYLKEVANEEAKELDSHVSFTIYEGAE